MPEDVSAELLVLASENMELRLQLADLQEQLVEVAVDAGDLHAQVQALQAQLVTLEEERNLWRQEAERSSSGLTISASYPLAWATQRIRHPIAPMV